MNASTIPQRAQEADMVEAVVRQPGRSQTSVEFVRSFLHRADQLRGEPPALATRTSTGWDELSYRQLDARSQQVRTWLSTQGATGGDRVALLGESGGGWVSGFFGILRAGAVVVPLDPSLTTTELDSLQARATWRAVVVSQRQLPTVDAVLSSLSETIPVLIIEDIAVLGAPAGSDVARPMHELALLVWTAGTTGRPKGVCLTFANLDFVVTQSAAEQQAAADDRWLSVLALNHMLELSCGLLACLRSGATMSFARSQMPHEIVRAMAERGVTRMMAVPLLLRLLQPALAKTPEAAAGLHALYSGGAPASRELLDSYTALNIPVYQGYGLTELAPSVAMNSPQRNRPGSVGRPLPGTDVEIADGEILVRSPGLMAGYWADPESTAHGVDTDGWFRTGDLGRLDEDGYLYVTGRRKNLVVLESGKNVSAEEVEAALAASDMFAEVCVVAVPVSPPTDGSAEAVCAVVVPTAEVRTRLAQPDQLSEAVEAEVRRCAQVLSGYKRPTMVEIVTEPLPKTVKLSLRRADIVSLVRERRGTR